MAQKKSKNLTKLIFGVIFSAIAVVLILVFGNSQNNFTAESAENIFYDQFFKWTTEVKDSTGIKDGVVLESKPYNDPGILIADIDEKSLQKLGHYYEWDRSIHAKVIKNLSEGGAAAVSFDILFKEADFGERRGKQCYNILTALDPDTSHFNLFSQIQSYYNYDSLLVEATRNSGICIVSFLMNKASNYKNKSDWNPLSTWDRAKEIGFSSTLQLNQVDKPQDIEPRQLLDNIFPELSNAGARIGAVNAYPDNDGIIRRISMLYKFPYVQDKLAPQRIYSTLSLMTILHLFHKDPKDVKVKMGEYIDIGKPFGIYRDSVGEYHTTYPNFTYPMFEDLRKKIKQIQASKKNASLVETSTKIVAKRNSEEQIVFDILIENNQHLNATLSDILRKLPENIFDKLEEINSIELDSGYTIAKSEDEEDFYTITDSNDKEIYITPSALKTIHFFESNYRDIKKGELKHLSRHMDISYNKEKNEWSASISFFTNQILQDISKATDAQINNLKPGEELRFGPYKQIPIGKHGEYLVKYKGRFNHVSPETRTFKHISYYDVFRDSTNLDQYAGKTIILGSSATALFDIVNGPHEENIPAILVHASIIKNVLEDDYLKILDEKYQRYIVILLAIICTFIGLYSGSILSGWKILNRWELFKQWSILSLFFTVIILVLYTWLAYICFKHNVYIGVSKQLLTIIMTNTFAMVIRAYFENREKDFITDLFKEYVSEEVIEDMIASGKTPELGGDESLITAYFTDIQGFSTFSEKMGSANKLIDFLNEYLSAMTDILVAKKGTLDKFEGDAIIAFFGAPVKHIDHAKRACDTALDMQKELLNLRKKWKSEGNRWPEIVHDLHMRIGINTGNSVTGHVGTDGAIKKKSYTMIGDEVNLAARLESSAKQYGAYIHVSKNTIDQLVEQGVDSQYIYRSLDIIRVVGKDEPVETFELLAYATDDNAMILNKLCKLWNEARDAYLDMNWDKAIELFTQCLDFEPHLSKRDPGSKDCPSEVFINRCIAYKQNPPAHAGETWDGIFTATEK